MIKFYVLGELSICIRPIALYEDISFELLNLQLRSINHALGNTERIKRKNIAVSRLFI